MCIKCTKNVNFSANSFKPMIPIHLITARTSAQLEETDAQLEGRAAHADWANRFKVHVLYHSMPANDTIHQGDTNPEGHKVEDSRHKYARVICVARPWAEQHVWLPWWEDRQSSLGLCLLQ